MDKEKTSFLRPFRKKAETESLKEEVTSLTRSVEELTILSDLTFAIGASTNPEEIVEKLIDRVMRAVKAQPKSAAAHSRSSANGSWQCSRRHSAKPTRSKTSTCQRSICCWPSPRIATTRLRACCAKLAVNAKPS